MSLPRSYNYCHLLYSYIVNHVFRINIGCPKPNQEVPAWRGFCGANTGSYYLDGSLYLVDGLYHRLQD